MNPANCYEHILIFHKHVIDDTKLPCPLCGSLKIQNNSQSEIGVQSWECNNPECIHRSEGNRGKRYSARSIMMDNGLKNSNARIPSKIMNMWRRDIVAFPPVIKINSQGSNIYGHSAPFLIHIPLMACYFYTYPFETVIDPFSGSFTTSIACMQSNRNSIGIELHSDHIENAKRKLKKFSEKNLIKESSKIIYIDSTSIDQIQIPKSSVWDKESYIQSKNDALLKHLYYIL